MSAGQTHLTKSLHSDCHRSGLQRRRSRWSDGLLVGNLLPLQPTYSVHMSHTRCCDVAGEYSNLVGNDLSRARTYLRVVLLGFVGVALLGDDLASRDERVLLSRSASQTTWSSKSQHNRSKVWTVATMPSAVAMGSPAFAEPHTARLASHGLASTSYAVSRTSRRIATPATLARFGAAAPLRTQSHACRHGPIASRQLDSRILKNTILSPQNRMLVLAGRSGRQQSPAMQRP